MRAAPGYKAQETAWRVGLGLELQLGAWEFGDRRGARVCARACANRLGMEGAPPSGCLALTPCRSQLALEQRCRELSARGRRLEETLPGRIGSEEQREVLSLLCRVHELEVENTEMQSHALLREGALRHRGEAVRRLEQHRALCDEIIQGQRQIIDGRSHTTEAPRGPTDPQSPKARPELCPASSRLQPGCPPTPGGAL